MLDLDINGASVIPVGMWSDATPHPYDRKQSIEILSLSFPSAVGASASNARIVVCVCEHQNEGAYWKLLPGASSSRVQACTAVKTLT
eukprot:3351433-Amphidinium_carterae.1